MNRQVTRIGRKVMDRADESTATIRVDIRVDDIGIIGPHILVTRSDVTGSLELPNECLGVGACFGGN
ncbi:unnamed protein product [Lasius platythorax]|uniref:Uncharacterized protein n=1 Tax=Lasius platythorax TaxID=488582 RepID=A0AAV2N3H6_9HYME